MWCCFCVSAALTVHLTRAFTFIEHLQKAPERSKKPCDRSITETIMPKNDLKSCKHSHLKSFQWLKFRLPATSSSCTLILFSFCEWFILGKVEVEPGTCWEWWGWDGNTVQESSCGWNAGPSREVSHTYCIYTRWSNEVCLSACCWGAGRKPEIPDETTVTWEHCENSSSSATLHPALSFRTAGRGS